MSARESMNLTAGQLVPGETFSVKCSDSKDPKYEYSSAFPGIRPEQTASAESSSTEKSDALNVLVLGFDSLSRAAFHRFLPETEKFLRETLKAAFFDRYSILGDGTPPGTISSISFGFFHYKYKEI